MVAWESVPLVRDAALEQRAVQRDGARIEGILLPDVEPRRLLATARCLILALALGVGLLGGVLPPAAYPAPGYAQTAGADGSASPTGGPGEQASAQAAPTPPGGESGGGAGTAPSRSNDASAPFAGPTDQADRGAADAAALWYAQQWQQAQMLAMAQQWQQSQALALARRWQAAQATLAAWRQSALAAGLLAQQTAAQQVAPAPPRPPVAPAPLAPANNPVRIQQSLALDGNGLCGLAVGHICQVGGDLTGSTVTPVANTGTAGSSQWRVLVPAGRIVAGATATVFVPTTRGIEFFDCPAATAGAQTVCVGQTLGHALQSGTVRIHVGNTAVAQGTVSGPGVNIQKLLIVVPGIDATQTTSYFDPYQRASNNFGSAVCSGFSPCTALFPTLNCPSQTGGPSTTFVPCGNSGLAWLPYSYEGVAGSGATGLPLMYTGADTGQRLARSSAAMSQIVALARALLGPSATSTQIILIGHSLGGAVSSDWAGANSPQTPIITMDSPVNGIWPTDDNVFDTYCFNSTGLLDVYNLSSVLCRALEDVPALDAAVVPDLQASATIAREGLANAVNFFNPADVIVPSWYAVNRQARHGAVQFVSNCGSFDFNHSCILGYAPAVTAAAAIIQSGTYPAPTPTRATINLNVTVLFNGSPQPNVPITVTQGSTPTCTTDCNPPSVVVGTATTGPQGTATISVPWRDSLVTANVGTLVGANCTMGALPANNTDLNLTIRAVSVLGCDIPGPPPPRR